MEDLSSLIPQLFETMPVSDSILDDITEVSNVIQWGRVRGKLENQKDLINFLTEMKETLEEDIKDKTSVIFHYKGNVANLDELNAITTKEVGDVYNVVDTGANYAWDGTGWDKLSETVDLSGLVTLQDFENAINNIYTKEQVDALITAINTALTLKADKETTYTKTEVDSSIDLVKEMFNDYYDKSEVDGLLAEEVGARQGADADLQDAIGQVASDLQAHIESAETGYVTNEQLNAGLNTKTDKEITSANGKALIFNESDGGGAKFEKSNGKFSFAGVNDMSGDKEIGVQLYTIDTNNNNAGPRVNLTPTRATYSVDKTEVGADYELVVKKDIANKADKVSELTTAGIGDIVQYVGETGTYKNGYFYRYVGEPYLIFEPKGGAGTVEVSIDNFKALLETCCEDRPFTAKDIVSGNIGYHNLTERYSFSATTADGKFFAISLLITEFQEAGVTFNPPLGPQQGFDFKCNFSNTPWVQVNVQPHQNINNKADRSDLNNYYTKQESDAKYLTEHQDITGKQDVIDDLADIRGKADTALQAGDNVSELINDAEYVSLNQLGTVENKVTEDSGSIASLISRLTVLEDRVANINKTNIEPAVIEDGAVNITDANVDYVLTGNITSTSSITGKSATIKDTEINSAVVTINATEDVDVKGTEIVGSFPTNKGSAMNVRADGYVTIKDCTISANGYNALEIGLMTGEAKNILIDNVNFEGKFNNNAISIFGTADDAVVTISNCHFEDVSNVIRISNRTNVKTTFNIINCTCDKWETGQYAGLIICQDYTSASAESTAENNLFDPDKIIINIQNLTKPDGTKLIAPENIADICGSGNNQIIYVYGDKVGIVSYNENRYPKLNIV